jgi:hypothetical protein
MKQDKDGKAKTTAEKRKEAQAAPSGKRSNAASAKKSRPSEANKKVQEKNPKSKDIRKSEQKKN